MRIILITLTIALWLAGNSTGISQEINNKNNTEILERIADLQIDKESIVQDEKDNLRKEVAKINSRVANGQLTATEAEGLKISAAEKTALNIENKVAIIDNRIALLERNGEDNDGFTVNWTIGRDKSRRNIGASDRDNRTYSTLVFAIGLNNALIDGQSLDDSPYRIGGSKFLELGYSWNTRVFENSNFLRINYGFSFHFNGLKFEDNNYLVDNGDGTNSLQKFSENLDKAKFRMDNLVIPIHFEFGTSKTIESDGKTVFDNRNRFKVGLGGYAGLNLSTIQKLKYEEDGNDKKEKYRGDYNTNNFIYGLSGYIGYDDVSLYVKYDLNPIFKTGVEQRNISAGLRFDF